MLPRRCRWSAEPPINDCRTPAGDIVVGVEHEHSAEAIQQRLQEGPQTSYLRDFIYGGIDGAVTTFAIVSGVVGGKLAGSVVIILGVANLVADGFSMAAANYSGTRAEHDEYEQVREMEYRHIREIPAGEREEVRQIYAAKGFEGSDLDRVVEVITSDSDRWVNTMLTEEFGLPSTLRSPWRAAWSTFLAFSICGFIPIAPFVFSADSPFFISIALTAITFFAIGSYRSRFTLTSWWRAGMETLAIGGAAAALAYVIGAILERAIGS